MASVTTEQATGLRRVLFVDAGGRRRTIRLGRLDKRQAETVRARVELLVNASIARQAPDRDTAAWVADLDDVLHQRLARVGLVRPREGRALGAWIDAYIESRSLKPRASGSSSRPR